MWEQYSSQITIAFAALLLIQAALISWLLYEHRRRHLAEVVARNTMAELTLYESHGDGRGTVSLDRS